MTEEAHKKEDKKYQKRGLIKGFAGPAVPHHPRTMQRQQPKQTRAAHKAPLTCCKAKAVRLCECVVLQASGVVSKSGSISTLLVAFCWV